MMVVADCDDRLDWPVVKAAPLVRRDDSEDNTAEMDSRVLMA